MLKVSACSVVHERTEEEPFEIVVGSAERVQASVGGGGGSSVTVMVAVHITEPPGPVAVPVYVTVASGETDVEPPATGVTEPMP